LLIVRAAFPIHCDAADKRNKQNDRNDGEANRGFYGPACQAENNVRSGGQQEKDADASHNAKRREVW
jgi:hypothetical protein